MDMPAGKPNPLLNVVHLSETTERIEVNGLEVAVSHPAGRAVITPAILFHISDKMRRITEHVNAGPSEEHPIEYREAQFRVDLFHLVRDFLRTSVHSFPIPSSASSHHRSDTIPDASSLSEISEALSIVLQRDPSGFSSMLNALLGPKGSHKENLVILEQGKREHALRVQSHAAGMSCPTFHEPFLPEYLMEVDDFPPSPTSTIRPETHSHAQSAKIAHFSGSSYPKVPQSRPRIITSGLRDMRTKDLLLDSSPLTSPEKDHRHSAVLRRHSESPSKILRCKFGDDEQELDNASLNDRFQSLNVRKNLSESLFPVRFTHGSIRNDLRLVNNGSNAIAGLEGNTYKVPPMRIKNTVSVLLPFPKHGQRNTYPPSPTTFQREMLRLRETLPLTYRSRFNVWTGRFGNLKVNMTKWDLEPSFWIRKCTGCIKSGTRCELTRRSLGGSCRVCTLKHSSCEYSEFHAHILPHVEPPPNSPRTSSAATAKYIYVSGLRPSDVHHAVVLHSPQRQESLDPRSQNALISDLMDVDK